MSSAKCLLVWILLYGCAFGQHEVGAIPNLQQILPPAAHVFVGRVMAVQYAEPKSDAELGIVSVTFKVEQGIRGVRTSTFTMREWAGLWNAGERYRVGERLVLFLYPPSRIGLTSAVGGPAGRFRVDIKGRVIVPGRTELSPRGEVRASSQDRVSIREFKQAVHRADKLEH
jgi:hypothetical protein